MRPPAVKHATDEVAQHLFGDLEVGDRAVTQRTDRRDRRRRAANHPIGLSTDRMHRTAVGVDRDDRRLRNDDPVAGHIDQRVRGPQVNSDVVHAKR